MDDAKAQLIDKLKTSNNVLVTVSRNPSVDQLSALVGLTLLLNKQGKHAAAVFSGEVPSTIEFLQPEETIEKNTDSLRDFIIALDKSKADKLRYKVEDNVVRIFITPYKTSISQEDLEFSQGDFNVDIVVALGVQQQEDLDDAITAHGRILHDATITSVNTSAEGGLGSINWQDPQASSLSELVTELIQGLGADLLDNQIATALLTGIVAETDRFSNEKTSSQTMSMSAVLMAAGANQQLVASKLDEPVQPPSDDDTSGSTADLRGPDDEPPKDNDGAIEIDHENNESADDSTDEAPAEGDKADEQASEPADDATPPAEFSTDDEVISEQLPEVSPELPESPDTDTAPSTLSGTGSKRMTEPPELGGMLTANTQTEQLEPGLNPMDLPTGEPPKLLDHDATTAAVIPVPEAVSQPEPPAAPAPAPQSDPMVQGLTPPPPAWIPPTENPLSQLANTTEPPATTLSQLETAVDSPHADTVDVNDARDEVNRAIVSSDAETSVASEPVEALNAQPLGGALHQAATPAPADPANPGPLLVDILDPVSNTTQPATILPVDAAAPAALPVDPATPAADPTTPQVTDPTAPPPVPPPIPFQFGTPGSTPPQP